VAFLGAYFVEKFREKYLNAFNFSCISAEMAILLLLVLAVTGLVL
jgi:hypothetical protein